jgi:hypothetical protein
VESFRLDRQPLRCSCCRKRRRCVVLNPNTGADCIFLCQECLATAYAFFLCAEAEARADFYAPEEDT